MVVKGRRVVREGRLYPPEIRSNGEREVGNISEAKM